MTGRGTQDIAAGTVIVAFAVAVLAALSRIPTAKFQAIPPDLFPRVCACALIACGIALVVRGVLRKGDPLALPRWRDVGLIVLSVVAFGVVAPRLGYAIAGFLTIVISGFAARDARPAKLLAFALALITFSVLLFSYALKVPMRAFVMPAFGS